jgi:hypothetical protein
VKKILCRGPINRIPPNSLSQILWKVTTKKIVVVIAVSFEDVQKSYLKVQELAACGESLRYLISWDSKDGFDWELLVLHDLFHREAEFVSVLQI